ncbi:MAG: ribonuclease III domain-containing protein [Promethearchaeota archaeon]
MVDYSDLKLTWKPIHLMERMDTIARAVHATSAETPKNNTRLLSKLERWLEDIKYMQKSMRKIEDVLVPTLQDTLGVEFKTSELFLVAMFQPSTKNLFLELETQYRRSDNDPLDEYEFAQMINLGEMAEVLALVGDAVISSAVLQHLWEPYLGNAGTITQRKAYIVSNEHMAKLCDKWGLYKYRIHFDPDKPSKSEMDHDKGTLVEAVYGIIYIDYEYDKVVELVTHLINTQ